MLNRFRAVAVMLVGCAGFVVAFGSPAGALAPQPIDASEQGPLAFVVMTVLCVLFVASLFYMDRVRQRRSDDTDRRG